MLKEKQKEIEYNYKKDNEELLIEFGKLCYKHNISLIAKSQEFYLSSTSTYWTFIDKDAFCDDFDIDSYDNSEIIKKVENLGFDINLPPDAFGISSGYEEPIYSQVIFYECGMAISTKIYL